MKSNYDICVVGGAGHVGAPFSVLMGHHGWRTLVYDLNQSAMELMQSGTMPFLEEQGDNYLKKCLDDSLLGFTSDVSQLAHIPWILLTIGTPIDEFHNPNFNIITDCLGSILPYLADNQVIILRSTVVPGTTAYIQRFLQKQNKNISIAFCPERVVQGKSIVEMEKLPQLISGTDERALKAARELFSSFAPEIVELEPLEAEYGKLLCNAYRYIEFAASNQFHMLIEAAGLDYNQLLKKLKQGYPRMKGVPNAGFAAGPCLMKDTMQLYSLGKKNFLMGQIAMMINEGLPNFVVEQLSKRYDLTQSKVGILGMAFKADSDDIRDSLSYKAAKVFRFHGAEVKCSDPWVNDDTFISENKLIAWADIIVIGAPHSAYKQLEIPRNKEVVDVWGHLC